MNITIEYRNTNQHHRSHPAQRPVRLRRPPQLSLRELRAEVAQMVG